MKRIVVFIPGIMGSKLKEPDAAGGRPLWYEHIRKAVSQLVRNPFPICSRGNQGIWPT